MDANYSGPNGDRWFIKEVPQLGKDASGNIAVIGIINDTLWFDKSGSNYIARYFIKETLSEDTVNKEFTFSDTNGRRIKFFNFDVSIPTAKQGQFKSFTDPYGNAGSVTYDGSDRISEYVQGTAGSGNNVRYKYDFYSSGDHTSRIQYVTQKRNDTINVCRVVNEYYPSSSSSAGDAFGTLGDLRRVTVQGWNAGTSAWDDLRSSYYRYYKAGDTNGFEHGLKYVLGPEAYARMVAAGSSPITASDATLATYADNYFEYNADKRVTREKVRGGAMTYDYSYTQSAHADGYNNWKMKTIETLPDGNQNIVYTNYVGQVMLKIFKVSTNEWYEYYKYDSAGRVIQKAESFAVLSYTEATAGLVTLKLSDGLIHVYDYYTSTDVPNGAVAGHLQYEKVKKGDTGSEIKLKEFKYTSRQGYGFPVIYPLWKEIVYRSDASGGSDSVETAYNYTWQGTTNQMESRTTTWPAVTTAQNGSNSTTSRVEWFDVYGRVTWLKDERGFITRFKYDDSSGGITQRINDVNTASVTDEPSGWTTPSGGGLHLVTDFQHDDLGRMTQELGPSHSIDISGTNTTIRRARWIVYKDTIQERWEGMGYATGSDPSYTYTLVNPVTITKMDRAGRTVDAIVATRASTSGKLSASDTFAQSTWVRWRKFNYDNNSRLTFERLYFSIPASGEGTSGTHYNQTDYGHDTMMRVNKTKSPGGTIRRTVLHASGRMLSSWIGTNDTGATETNPAGTGSPNNMVKVEEREYDSGVDKGDGNLTKTTLYENATTTRVTTFAYDWRNRQMSIDGEIDFYEAHEYDNLSRVTKVERKDTTAVGNLISRRETKYDNRGRMYQELGYGVDPTTGTVGNSLANDFWYDGSGNLIKEKRAGSSALHKRVYDGIGRLTKQYVSYDTAETSYADAGAVTGDTVIEQIELNYDAASNLIQQLKRARFHDATGTGELNGPGTDPKARVSYLCSWPDAIGRTKATANYGTNGGSSLSRPATIPARSDTVLVMSIDYNEKGEAYQTTDPKGTKTYMEFDSGNRVTKQIHNYIDGIPSADTDQTVEYAYNADGATKSMTVKNSTTGDQVTKYAYGTTLTDSDVASNELLRAVIYPDSDDTENPLADGADAIYDRIEFKYNRLGQQKETKDQMGTIHILEYDKLGRVVHDRITTLASGVDGAVKRVSRTYEVRGMLAKITSYDNDTVGSGSVVNEVQFDYNNFEQLSKEYQSHSGAVNILTTPKLEYSYADGSANHVRPTQIKYPDGRIVELEYFTAGAIDDLLSRPYAVKVAGTRVAIYSYLGVNRTIKVRYDEPGVDVTYIKEPGPNGDAGDQYNGLDRFGRVVDVRWMKSTHLERVKYGFDRAGNRLWRENLVASSGEDEYYTYDGLYRLTNMDRGDLNGTYTGISGTAAREEDFTYDPTGNWTSYVPKTNGTNDFSQTRTHNKANEVTQIDGASTYIAQNLAGNVTKMPKMDNWSAALDLTYDAWNRLVKVVDGSNTVAEYAYDGANRRTVKKTYVGGSQTRHYYYSNYWQVVEERLDSSSVADRQFVWGLRYDDDLILRDRGTERLYALHDAFHVTALLDTAGAVQERYRYDAYGTSRVMDANFNSRAASNYDWEIRYGAYRWDAESGLYHVRNRYLHPTLGRWLSRDPLGYAAGVNLYLYCDDNPISQVDPTGTVHWIIIVVVIIIILILGCILIYAIYRWWIKRPAR